MGETLAGRKILVSGSHSVVGRFLLPRLINEGADVFIAGNGADYPYAGLFPGTKVVDIWNDVDRDYEIIIFLNNPEFVPDDLIDDSFFVNELASLRRLLKIAEKNVSYFIYLSTTAVYGKQKYLPIDEEHPLEPFFLYGAVKLAGEYFCKASALAHGFLYTIIRIGDLYGPGASMASPLKLMKNVISGKPLQLCGRGEEVRSYLFIEDAVDAILKVLYNKTANQVFNVTGDEYVSTWHLAGLIKQLFSPTSEISKGNAVLADEMECCIDSGKAENLIGFRPKINLKDGLEITFKWLSSRPG